MVDQHSSVKRECVKGRLLYASGFFFVLFLIWWVLSPLLPADFVLDDHGNLAPMGAIKHFHDARAIWEFILTNASGVLGRPVSMASFLISDFTWPSDAKLHRLVNLKIHYLNVVLLFAILEKLSILAGSSLPKQRIIILLALLLWAVSPVLSGTIYSVVQRMTLLSSTFTLLGCIAFVYWRSGSLESGIFKHTVYILLIFFCLIFSILSKENGILLIGYLLIIEFTFKSKFQDLGRAWRILVIAGLLLYTLGIVGLNVSYLFNETSWANRDFGPVTRLLAQLVIIPDYAFKLMFFRVENTGIYQGDAPYGSWFTISKVLFATGFWSVFIWSLMRLPFPLKAFPLWFINGHLLESFLIPLELYFEHRNYLSAVAVYLPVSYVFFKVLSKRILYKYLLLFLVLGWLLLVRLNNHLLSDPLGAAAIFAIENPDSHRAKSNLVYQLSQESAYGTAEEFLNALSPNESSMLRFFWMCRSSHIPFPMQYSEEKIGVNHIIHVRTLVEMLKDKACNVDADLILEFIERSLNNNDPAPHFMQKLLFEKANVYAISGDLNGAILSLDQAIEAYSEEYLFLTKSNWLVSAGLYSEALATLHKGIQIDSSCKYWSWPCKQPLVEMYNTVSAIANERGG